MANQDFRVKNGLEVGVGATLFSVGTDGKVGIRTTAPQNIFQVGVYNNRFVSLASTTGTVSIAGTDRITGIDTSVIQLGNQIQSINGLISSGTTVTQIGITSIGIGATTLGNASDQVFVFGKNDDAEVFAVTSSGDVGIGTTNPSTKLDVDGNVDIDGTLNVSDKVYIGFKKEIYFANDLSSTAFQISQTGNTSTVIRNNQNNGVLALEVGNSGSGRLLIRNRLSGEIAAQFTPGADAELYYDGNKKLETTGVGITVIGDLHLGVGNTATISGPSNIIIDPHPVGVATTSGNVYIRGDLYVEGTQFQVNSTTINLADKVIGVGTTCTSDALLDGAGIGIGSDGNQKTFTFEDTGDNLKSSENLNLASGKSYKINNTSVLNGTTLGSNVVNSSLTSLGTIATGTWQGTAIDDNYIGTINNTDKVSLSALNIDGGLAKSSVADSDLMIIDDSVNVPKKVTASTLKSYFGTASYATSAGIATYATTAGIATYATSAGIATYATSAGLSTNASKVAVSQKSDDTNYHLVLTDLGASSNYDSLYNDSDNQHLRYNPSTNALTISSGSVGLVTGANFYGGHFYGGGFYLTGVSTITDNLYVGAGDTGVFLHDNGSLIVSGVSTYKNTVRLQDDVKVAFGTTDNNLQIYHNGTNYIKNGTVVEKGKDLSIQCGSGKTISVTTYNGAHKLATFSNEGTVKLYHQGSEKLSISTTGADVTGVLKVGTGVTISAGVITASTFSGTATNATNAISAGYASSAGISTYTSEWILGADGSNHYTFTGPGLIGAENDPTLYLTRGQKYKFTNKMGAHPFQIQSVSNGNVGAAYTDGIENSGVSNGTLTWDIQFDAPSILYYQCTAHGNMGGKIYIDAAGLADPDADINTTGIITASQFSSNGICNIVGSSGTFTASAGVSTDIDSISININNFKTIEYTLGFENGSNIQAQKVLVMQNGTKAFYQEYGIMSDPNTIVSIGATIVGSNLKLLATPESGISGLTTFRIMRGALK